MTTAQVTTSTTERLLRFGPDGDLDAFDDQALREAWRKHGDRLTRSFARAWPGCRPHAFWKFGEHRRRRIDGRLHPLERSECQVRECFGIPAFPTTEADAGGVYETQLSYLRREGLLIEGEAEAVSRLLASDDGQAISRWSRIQQDGRP